MNKIFIIGGIICSILWSFVTAMSLGLSSQVCDLLNLFTFNPLSNEINKMANGFYYDVSNSQMPTIVFLIVCLLSFILVFYLFKRVEKSQTDEQTLWIVVGFAVLFRLILLPSVPVHENDFYRYLWDGKSAVEGINPYKYAPADLFMYEEGYEEDYFDEYSEITIKGKHFDDKDEMRLDRLINLRDANGVFYDRIGHSEVPTIYPPVTQSIFAAIAKVNADTPYFMKFIFIIFDLGVITLIILLLKHTHKNPSLCILYAWSPLVLKEISNSGHFDSIAVFFTFLSIYLCLKKKMFAGSLGIALATLSKFFSCVLLPILIRPRRLKPLLLFVLLMIGSYVPYFLWDETGVRGVFEGFLTYNKEWSYNASIFSVIYNIYAWILPNESNGLFLSKFTAGLLYLGMLFALYKRRANNDLDIIYKCFWAIALLFIINPVGDPWYFCWSVPFLCFFPFRSWILLSSLLLLSYLNFHTEFFITQTKIWDIRLVSWIIYIPFYSLFVWEMFNKPAFCKEIRGDTTK